MKTATNPETGARVVFVGGKWEPIEQSATNSQGGKAYRVYGKWITQDQETATQTAPERDISAVGATGQGLNVGMAQTLGAPVDVLNTGLGFVGLGSREPVGGSGQLRRLMGKIPTGGTPLTYTNIEDVPQAYRPLARGAEAFGASVIPATIPFKTAKGITELPKFVQPIVQAARTSPGKFLATEATGAFGASQGAAISELLFPDNVLAAFTSEVIGGLLNPAGALVKLGSKATKGAVTFGRSLTRAGRVAKASQVLQDALIAAGEDPKEVARLLREVDLEGINLSAGQKAESPTLMAGLMPL